MKNKYNPYTVPENFFESTCSQAISRYRAKKRAVICIAVAAVLLIVPLFFQTLNNSVQEPETASNNLAAMYEYDIFLQVNCQ